MKWETFGSPAQSAMQITGEHLLALLKDDPRYCSHGRGLQNMRTTDRAKFRNERLTK